MDGARSTDRPATAICANSKNLLALFHTTESSRETGIQLMTPDGKIVSTFSSFFPFDRRMACVMDESHFYVAVSKAYHGDKGLSIGKFDIDAPPRGRILCDIPIGNHIATTGYNAGSDLVDVEGLALNGGRLYVPVKLDDKVVVVDAESGAILGSAAVPSPRGVATFGGKVYALSGATLVPLDADGHPGTPILSAGLDDPAGLAIDAQGNFYIADGGASQQVKVFTADSRPLPEIGKKGGRPRNGLYDPAGMLDPRGLCVAPDGKVWVAEIADDYQILGRWNPDGTREKSFYNMHWSSGQGRLSPDRDELFFGTRSSESSSGLTSYRIDLQKGIWNPPGTSACRWRLATSGMFFSATRPYDRQKAIFGGHMPYLSFEKDMVKATNGKIYLTGGDYSIYLFDPQTKTAKLASLIYGHHVTKTADGLYQGYYDQGPSNWLTWADLNGDGRMSRDEVRYTENPPLRSRAEDLAHPAPARLEPSPAGALLAAQHLRSGQVVSLPPQAGGGTGQRRAGLRLEQARERHRTASARFQRR
ncbi:MAG: hypothetical protein WDO13_08165 [Verrucomicrobiota bacterium]